MFSLDGYQALRRRAAIVRRTDRGVLKVTGADRLTWLQGLLTNDVLALPVGGVCDAAYLTPQGRMITDLRVINGGDFVILDVPGRLAADLRQRLDGLLFAEDAQIEDVSDRLAMIDLHGPVVASWGSGPVPPDLADVQVAVVDGPLGVPGISFVVTRVGADAVVDWLKARGAEEVSLETLEVVRVEAGRPAFLIDMDEHTIPLEAGLEDRAISFTKGCYVGQEVIVRVMHRGQGRVAKKLVGLQLAAADLPLAHTTIAAGERDIGRVTSAVWSPTLERAVALGYVHRDFTDPGTTVIVKSAPSPIEATVVTLPFVPAIVGPLSLQS